jgi:hypothetical protein
MRRFPSLIPLLIASAAFAAPTAPPPAAPVLPQSFAGWTSVLMKDAPAAPGPEEAGVLQEFGLSRTEVLVYTKGSADLIVGAWEFKDATGAYGAFTFYRQQGMRAENLGAGGASAGEHYVFWTGATVVDATFTHPASDEKSALAVLAGMMPKVAGGASVPPSLPHYLPAANLDASTVRYAIGPAAYARMGGAVPVSNIDFGLDAEAVTAQYGIAGASTTLTLIMYPTPQIAEGHLKTMLAATQGLHAKRSGPLLAVVSGNLEPEKAQTFLASIHFNDAVTINHPEGYVSEGAKMYRLLIGITMLTVILMGAAILLGIFLGGGRALLRVMRGKTASALSEEEFISLHLEQGGSGSQGN